MADHPVIVGGGGEGHVLPECGDYAMVAMRYRDVEFAFCMTPEQMEHGLIPTVEALRDCVFAEPPLDKSFVQT